MKHLRVTFIFIIIATIISSCATIISSPMQKVKITSNPVGAEIFVNSVNTGSITPATIKVKRRVKGTPNRTKQTQMYVLKKDGYGDVSHQAKSKFGIGPFLGNVLIGGAIGWIIDGASGSNRKYPNEHHFILTKGSSSDLLIDRAAEITPPIVNETKTEIDYSTKTIEELKKEMETAVVVEDYETAAKIKQVLKDKSEMNTSTAVVTTPSKTTLPVTKDKTSSISASTATTNPIPSKNKASTTIVKKEVNAKIKKDKEYTKVAFEANINKSVKGEFPAQEIYNGMHVFPIGMIQGIEIGYAVDIDSDWDLDGTSYSDREVTLIVRNRTGKRIVFNNSMDKVVEVKFTGENVEFDIDAEGKFYRERMGSKCPLYAFTLDKENGKYIMEPDHIYEWDYSIAQDAETMVGGMLNRRFKTLWAKSYVPIKHKGVNNSTKFLIYPDVKLSKSPKEISNGFSTQKVSLPNKKIEVTPAIRGISQKTVLKNENGYTVVFENNNIKVMYLIDGAAKLDKDYGYLVYDIKVKIENVSDNRIMNKWRKGKIGWLQFYNARSIPLHLATYSGIHGWEKEPYFKTGSSIEYKSKIKMTYFSGELWEAKSFSNRSIELNHPLVVKNIKIINQLMASEEDFSPKNDEGKTLIHVYGKVAEMIDVDPNFDPMKDNSDDIGALMGGGTNRIAVSRYNKYSDAGGVKIYFDETATVFQPIKGKHSYTFEMPKGGMFNLFTSGSKKITSEKLIKSKAGRKFASAFYTKSNLKEGNEVFYILKYGNVLEKVTKQHYYDFIKDQPYSNPNSYFKVNSEAIIEAENKKIAERLSNASSANLSTNNKNEIKKTTETVLPKNAVVILDEDFSDNSFGWKEVNIKASKYNVIDGHYAMKEVIFRQRSPLHLIPNFNSRSDNYILEASLSFLDNKKSRLVGISLGFSSDSSICYSFNVMVTSTYEDKKFIANNIVAIAPDFGLSIKSVSQKPIYSGTPKSFNNNTNIIKIIKQDDVTKFYINDEFLAESGNFVFNSSLLRFNAAASSSSVNWIKMTKTGTSKVVINGSNKRDFSYKKIKSNEIASATTKNTTENIVSKTNGKKLKIKKSEENIGAKNLKYRRSSLYTMMIYDPIVEHSKTIKDAFGNLEIPSKFNDHNVGPYSILSITNIKQQEKQISNFLRKNDIAKKMVSKWFNRDTEGKFNMDMIAERGLYDASAIDKAIASNMARGNAMLADAGEELINKTFIVVNDFKFFNKADKAKFLVDALKESGKGDGGIFASALSSGVKTVAKGYVIRSTSYLYRLEWTAETQAIFYQKYWTDANNFDPKKVEDFNKTNGYKLKFIGSQSALADVQSTTLSGKSDEDLIRMATVKAIDKAIGKLERKFEAFRTKTPLVSTEPLAAKIGTKEGLEKGDKFEVLEKSLDPETGKMTYKRVGVIKVDGNNIWNNSYSPEEMKQLEKEGELPKLQYTIFKGSGKYYPGQLIKQIN